MDRPGSGQWRSARADQLLAFGRGAALTGQGFGWLAGDGTVDTTKPRPLYITARMTYAYALAFLDGGDAEAARLATSGLRSLLAEYRDPEHGGWYASLDNRGQVSDPGKANYAHAHVLLAAATALVGGLEGAAEVLDATVTAINNHFWSDEDGAAVENWDVAYAVLEPYRGANSNMHSVEAYLVAGDVTGDRVWHARGRAIADKLINGFAREHGWRLPEHYDESWRPVLDYNRDHPDDQFRPYGTTPGHSFEWARLLLTLEAALADPPDWLLEAAIGLYDVAARNGWAADSRPGFVYTLDFDDRPLVTKRLHWVVCEAVLAAHSLHRRTGNDRYLADALRWWAHIDEHFIDPANGSWEQELDGELKPATSIWSGRPDVYHSYQALLLPSLPLAPCAALALADRGRERG